MNARQSLLRNVSLILAVLFVTGCPVRVGQPNPQGTVDQGESDNTLEIRKKGEAPTQPTYNPQRYVLPFNHGEP
jgi:hypothetical protein